MDNAPVPDLRASDADRERTAERIRRAAGEGQLTLDELDERLTEVYASRTRGELQRLTADLSVSDDAWPVAPGERGGFSVRRGEGGARWLVAIMGGCERKGRWRLSERATSLNIMGGSELDLNEVELGGNRVELTVFSLMGGSEIRVPEGLRVEVSDFALMGGNSVDIGREPRTSSGPVLHLRLISIMGGTDVKRGPKLSRAERQELQRRERERRLGH